MKRSRWVIIVAALLLAAGAGWYFVSPSWTLSRMKAAAEARDGDAFAAYVDFTALREDLKAELTERMAAEARRRNQPYAELGLAFATALINPLVDNLVSPAGLRTAFVAGAAATEAGRPRLPAMRVDADPVIVRRGLSEFLVASREHPDAGFVFRRRGLSWKLSGVDLPAELGR